MQMSDRIGKRMKLQDLHVLMAVVQAGSMGKAALMLNTTQPNISRSIGELERAFGVRLLDRHQRGIEPTECGRALLDCGAAVFDELRQGVKSIEFLADPTAGEVRIGSTAFLAASFVCALIDRLSRRHPRIKFQLVTGYIEALHRDLSERKVDLLIVRSTGELADDRLRFEFLFEDRYVVVAGAKNRWGRRRKIQISELADESWVLPPRESVIGSIVWEAFRAAGLDYPHATVVTDSPHMRVSLLTTGRFITIFPASALRFLARKSALRVLPVDLPKARRPNGIVTLKDRALSPVAQLTIDSARELAKPMAKPKSPGHVRN
ncbi:LysR family transcriptional regulator [Bradyrhizobium manausense]|uniref:LysR family transcriptional regulator n=1 Tax=Bradyrhizobium manausense TaxID=989370 RepID=UPI001BA46DCA|nr:LysR family transcriptional regulator [Bradyrhizobium manausense]MBR0691334.1 LysR family transcriptional regulator [Bradyrhizobium manausense]MBR0725338.1 LysR family transcriptional regulator [Bradyrhizobium manausense]